MNLMKKLIIIMLTFVVVLATLSLYVFATDTLNIEVNKNKIEKDELSLTIEKLPNNKNEIIVDTSLQGEYFKYENSGKYICDTQVDYIFTDEIVKIFDFSIVSEPDLGKISGTFEDNNIIWNIGDITTNEAVHFKFKLQLKQDYDLTQKTYPLFSKLAFQYCNTGFGMNEKDGKSYINSPTEKVVTDIPEITISRVPSEDDKKTDTNTNTDKNNEVENNTNISNSNSTNTNTDAGTNTNINDNANSSMRDNNNENTNLNTNNTLSPTKLPNTGLIGFLKIAVCIIIITILFSAFKLHQLK